MPNRNINNIDNINYNILLRADLRKAIVDGSITSIERRSEFCRPGSCYFVCNYRSQTYEFVMDAINRGATIIASSTITFDRLKNDLQTYGRDMSGRSINFVLADDPLDLLAESAKLFFSYENKSFVSVRKMVAEEYMSLLESRIVKLNQSEAQNNQMRKSKYIIEDIIKVLGEYKSKDDGNHYDSDRNRVLLHAVTGTSGKTTIAYFAAQMLPRLESSIANYKKTSGGIDNDREKNDEGVTTNHCNAQNRSGRYAIYRGTLGTYIMTEDENIRIAQFDQLNTPDIFDLYKMMVFANIIGVYNIFFEASSHGLMQERLRYVPICAAAISNIGDDEHLEYHGDVGNYSMAKEILFRHNVEINQQSSLAIIHLSLQSNPRFANLLEFYRNKLSHVFLLEYGMMHEASNRISGKNEDDRRDEALNDKIIVTHFAPNSHFEIRYKNVRYRYEEKFMLDIFVENFLAALCLNISAFLDRFKDFDAACDFVLFSLQSLGQSRCKSIENPPGRMEKIYDPGGKSIYVDYAHKTDAFMRILAPLQSERSGGRKIWIVFGCGGERSVSKRFSMGKIAQEMCDFVIITEDNPRGENPARINAQILLGCHGYSYDQYDWSNMSDAQIFAIVEDIDKESEDCIIIPSRKHAIRHAIDNMSNDDILIIAGKGHESEVIIGDKLIYLNDSDIAREVIAGL